MKSEEREVRRDREGKIGERYLVGREIERERKDKRIFNRKEGEKNEERKPEGTIQ